MFVPIIDPSERERVPLEIRVAAGHSNWLSEHFCCDVLGTAQLHPCICSAKMASISATEKSRSNEKPQNIVFFHPDLGIGGAERLILDAAVGLQDRGHKVVIYTSHCDPKHCFDEARDGELLIAREKVGS